MAVIDLLASAAGGMSGSIVFSCRGIHARAPAAGPS
jgi:hypothetical protein